VNFDAVGILFRWLHILPAAIVVGGTLFMRFVLLPASGAISDDQHERLAQALRSKWSTLLNACMAMLIVSGLYNVVTTVKRYDLPAYYHPLFGVKFLLALVIFYIAVMLSGRSAAARRMQKNARFWLSVNSALVVLIVLIGGVLRMAERSPKSAEPDRRSSRLHEDRPQDAVRLDRYAETRHRWSRIRNT